jgi:multiple sugar transport system permease protein
MEITAQMPALSTRRRPLSAGRLAGMVPITLVWLGALLSVAPVLYVLVQSLRVQSRGPYSRPGILAYESTLQSDRLWIAFKNTSIEEAIVLITTLFFCPLAGYAFAKFKFPGKSLLFCLTALTLFFAPITQLIPLLLEMKELNLIDTYAGLVVPLVVSSLGIFWMTMVIRNVPDEILDAAHLDGCGSFSSWWRIVLPVIKPSLLTLGFVMFLTTYNDYVWPLLVLPSEAMQTIQLYLQTGAGGIGYGGASTSSIVLTSIPTVLVFIVMQRYFMPTLSRRLDIPVPEEASGGDRPHFAIATAPIERMPARPTAGGAESATPIPAAQPIAPDPEVLQLRPGLARILAFVGMRPWIGSRSALIVRCAVIVGCTVVVYCNALRNGLLLDDVYRVTGNQGVERLTPIWRHFTDPFTSATIPSIAQFRPLLPLSLSLNHALTGDSLVGYHIVNLLLDAATGIVGYFLVRELLGHWMVKRLAPHRVDFLAMTIALLVTLHPVAGMLITYVSGRDLLLMQLFLSSSLLVYLHMQRQDRARSSGGAIDGTPLTRLLITWFGGLWLGWLAALALFELAMLSKLQAIVLPALILAFGLTVARGSLSRLGPYTRALPFALVAWANLAYVDGYLHFAALPDAPNISSDATWTYPQTQARLSVLHYLPNFAWPFNMRAVPVQATIDNLLDPGVVLGLIVIIATLIAAWFLRRFNPLLAFCILAYWIAQSPESSVTPMIHNVADYRPYPSCLYLFLILALLLERYVKPVMTTSFLLLLVLFFGAASIAMNTVW